MKKKINFADVGKNNIMQKMFYNIMRNSIYDFEISPNPDYIICGDFRTYEYLNYDCVRIFFTGENMVPDFNLYDYAVGMNHIQFMDRYFRYPFYMWSDGSNRGILSALKENVDL